MFSCPSTFSPGRLYFERYADAFLSLSGAINAKGYAVVQVDHEVCIRCGVCYTVCPDYVFEIREGE